MVPWVGLQYVIVVFPDHNYLLFLLINSRLGVVFFLYNMCTGTKKDNGCFI